VNPNDIARSRPAQVAIKGEPVPTPASVGEAAIRRYHEAELALQREELRLAKREELMKPIVGQRLEPAQADASQLLVALQMDQKARQMARERERQQFPDPRIPGSMLPRSVEKFFGGVGAPGVPPRQYRDPKYTGTPPRSPRRPKVGGAGDA
jgi:hypothetical protein